MMHTILECNSLPIPKLSEDNIIIYVATDCWPYITDQDNYIHYRTTLYRTREQMRESFPVFTTSNTPQHTNIIIYFFSSGKNTSLICDRNHPGTKLNCRQMHVYLKCNCGLILDRSPNLPYGAPASFSVVGLCSCKVCSVGKQRCLYKNKSADTSVRRLSFCQQVLCAQTAVSHGAMLLFSG